MEKYVNTDLRKCMIKGLPECNESEHIKYNTCLQYNQIRKCSTFPCPWEPNLIIVSFLRRVEMFELSKVDTCLLHTFYRNSLTDVSNYHTWYNKYCDALLIKVQCIWSIILYCSLTLPPNHKQATYLSPPCLGTLTPLTVHNIWV